MNEMRRLMNLCEADGISLSDLRSVRKRTGSFNSPGKFIRSHAENALRIAGVPEKKFMLGMDRYIGSWVDTGKTASRIKYAGLADDMDFRDIERIREIFQSGLSNYKTEVYEVQNRDQRFRGRMTGLAFKIYFPK